MKLIIEIIYSVRNWFGIWRREDVTCSCCLKYRRIVTECYVIFLRYQFRTTRDAICEIEIEFKFDSNEKCLQVWHVSQFFFLPLLKWLARIHLKTLQTSKLWSSISNSPVPIRSYLKSFEKGKIKWNFNLINFQLPKHFQFDNEQTTTKELETFRHFSYRFWPSNHFHPITQSTTIRHCCCCFLCSL